MPACRGCGAAIEFVLTKAGKKQPISLKTGESHFIDCPQAARFKRPALDPNTCHRCGSVDLEHLPGQGQHAGAIRCRDCRAHRWLRKTDVTT